MNEWLTAKGKMSTRRLSGCALQTYHNNKKEKKK